MGGRWGIWGELGWGRMPPMVELEGEDEQGLGRVEKPASSGTGRRQGRATGFVPRAAQRIRAKERRRPGKNRRKGAAGDKEEEDSFLFLNLFLHF